MSHLIYYFGNSLHNSIIANLPDVFVFEKPGSELWIILYAPI